MFRDFLLACLHHIAAFSLVAFLAIEWALIRPDMDAATIKQLGRVDLGFDAAAVTVLAAGMARVFYGIKGPAYYLGNWVFWTKFGVFALICALSIGPKLRFLGWSRLMKCDPKALLAQQEITPVKRMILVELALVLPLLILGAAIARGYGLP